jgi:maleamate amidohydrolase
MADGSFGAAAGFGARPAVLVVDLIAGFTDPASPLGSELGDVVAATREVLDAARAAGHPVAFTTTYYDAAGERAAAVFLRKVPALAVLRPGSRWIEIDDRLGRLAEEPVVPKLFASAFAGTALAALLADRDTLVICGASTSGCIRASVVDAMQHGLAPIVPREAVGDRWAPAHEANLFDIEKKYGDVLPLGDVLRGLRESARAVDETG